VFQCIYAQCETSRFGTALHYTISQCARSGINLYLVSPPSLGHDELKRRELNYVQNKKDKIQGSGSDIGFPTRSAGNGGFPIQSAGGFLLPTMTASPSAATTSPGFVSFTGSGAETDVSTTVPVLGILVAIYLAL
jgi:hypothetical protein